MAKVTCQGSLNQKSEVWEQTYCSLWFPTYLNHPISIIIKSLSPSSLLLLKVSSPLKLEGFLVFEIWTKRGVMKKLRNSGLVERGGVLLERGGFQTVSSVFLQKSLFSLLLDFFCLVNIHACFNQSICSFTWFTFY